MTATDQRAATAGASGSRDSASRRSATEVLGGGSSRPAATPAQHPAHVRVQDRVPLPEREARHRGGGVGADAGQRPERFQ